MHQIVGSACNWLSFLAQMIQYLSKMGYFQRCDALSHYPPTLVSQATVKTKRSGIASGTLLTHDCTLYRHQHENFGGSSGSTISKPQETWRTTIGMPPLDKHRIALRQLPYITSMGLSDCSWSHGHYLFHA